MAIGAHLRLQGALLLLLLALVPWPAQAGTQDDPEVTDPDGDPEIQGFPIGEVAALSDGIDIIKGWVEEDDVNLVLAIEVVGDITLLEGGTSYQFDFHFTAGGTDNVASATWDGSFAPAGVATAVAAEGSVLRLTVPKADVSVFRGDALTGLFAETSGTLVSDPLSSALDRAPDSGSGRDYNATMGLARGGTASDQDADGLPDAWETEHFGNVSAQNGTGDPDADTLNNTAENDLGTDPMDADTDGDGLPDGTDPAPLTAASTGAGGDSDGDGLNDTWEREHFTNITAQDGDGDPDGDDLENHEEFEAGTDPNQADTDGDGFQDANDADPLDPNVGGATELARKARPELYIGSGLFGLAATFILLGLAKGI